MKFLKKHQLNPKNVRDDSVSAFPNGEIRLDTTYSLLVPKGTTDERPSNPVNGFVRYNVTDNELEVYQNNAWRKVAYKDTVITGSILQQDLGVGDDIEVFFGPLDSGDPENLAPPVNEPQRLIVLVENVFQLSVVNYTLVLADGPGGPLTSEGYAAGTYIKFSEPVPDGMPVYCIHGFDR